MKLQSNLLLSALWLFVSPVLGLDIEPLLRKRQLAAENTIKRSTRKSSPQQDVLLDDIRYNRLSSSGFPFDTIKNQKNQNEKSGTRIGNNRFSPADRRLVNLERAWNEGLPDHAPSKTRRTSGEPPMEPFQEEDEPNTQNKQSTTEQPPWPHEMSDIPLDPAITYGELENGLRYYVMPNSEPPGKLDLRMHIDVGANFEGEDEQGIAHFLEHMMFQTTRNFPDGDIIPIFQRLGIGLGVHLNAYTSFDETVYILPLPDTDNETLTVGFQWMRDVLDGALLEPNEIEAERGIIISEMEVRESVEYRLFRDLYKWQIPDHRLSQRFPIGTEETILGVTPDMFVDFYQQYYVPRTATFIAVGDMNATDIVALIEENFGSATDSGNRGEIIDYGTVPPSGRGLRTNVFVDNQLRSEQVNMETLRNTEFLPDTEAQRIADMQLSIANDIVSNRFLDISEKEGSMILFGSAESSRNYGIESGSISVVPKEGLWREAVATLEQEFRRLIEFGFTQSEVGEAKSNRLNEYEQRALSKDTRQSQTLVGTINDSVNGRFVVSSPEEDLRIAEIALDSITPDVLHDVFRAFWDTTDIDLYHFAISINGTVEEHADELEELFLASQQVEVDPPQEEEAVVFAYTDFGPPGTIISDSFVEDLEVRQLVLSNNARVNMKYTDFEADTISFVARFGTGQLSQPKNRTFLDQFTTFMMESGGLGNHTTSEIDSVLTGRSASFSFSVGQDSFSFAGGSSSRDLELAMQLLTAYIIDPSFAEQSVGWWRDEIPYILASFKFSLGATYNYDLFPWLLGGDERFTAPTEEELFAFEASDARDWLMPFLTSSYMEFSIVGDFNESATLDLLLETIGALPTRDGAPAEVTEEQRFIDIPTAPQTREFPYESSLPQAGAFVTWEVPSFVDQDIEKARRFNVLNNVLDDRMRIKIREELGGAYSPQVAGSRSEAFEYGFIIAIAQGLPEEVEIFTEIILGIAANLTTGDITQDEFDRAVSPFQSRLADTLRSNSYWLSVIDSSQMKPYSLDWARGRDEFYEAMTVDQINSMAMEYLAPGDAFQLSIIPVNNTEAASDVSLTVDRSN